MIRYYNPFRDYTSDELKAISTRLDADIENSNKLREELRADRKLDADVEDAFDCFLIEANKAKDHLNKRL